MLVNKWSPKVLNATIPPPACPQPPCHVPPSLCPALVRYILKYVNNLNFTWIFIRLGL